MPSSKWGVELATMPSSKRACFGWNCFDRYYECRHSMTSFESGALN